MFNIYKNYKSCTGAFCGLRNSLSHWTVGTCISLCQPAKQMTKKAAGRVSVVASPTLKLDLCRLLFKIESFEPFVHTLFRVVASFYQGGRGSTLRGKWMIFFQIGRRSGAYLTDGD